MRPDIRSTFNPLHRVKLIYAILLIVGGLLIVRLFYLQVIRHDHYQKTAAFSQLKEYEIPAARGTILAHSGDEVVPLVLNETLYTLYADPVYVEDKDKAADKIVEAIGGNRSDYKKKLDEPDSPRYSVLAKRLNGDQHQKIDALKLKGIGTREAQFRTYPDGQLAAQLLGFVNDDGQGVYGLEQALNKELSGSPGQLKAITDAEGVPLAANKDNVQISPQNGQNITLTIDIGVQQQLEEMLKSGVEASKAKSGSAVILDANSGAVKAMAGFPTYNPAEYYKVTDSNLFNNTPVSAPLEVGSIMKSLTVAAALDMGVVSPGSTYFDSGSIKVDDARITNVEEVANNVTRSVADIIQYSLNTGVTWLLSQMGGGEINEKARLRWHDYMVNHYQLGKPTGIEQGYEAEGYIPSPTDGFGLNITYANSTFGQGMSATPLQMAAAFSAIVNGGTYYQPTLVASTNNGSGEDQKKEPKVVKDNVVSKTASDQIRGILENAYLANRRVYGVALRSEYSMGGKTGTAQINKPEGGYYDDKFNGTYVGFIGGDKPEYVIVVSVIEPQIKGYAGSRAAAPIYFKLANMLIDSYGVTPKTLN